MCKCIVHVIKVTSANQQANGENVLAAIPELSRSLQQPSLDAAEDAVFFDVLGLFMVTCSASLARWLHSLPLLLVLLLLPLALRLHNREGDQRRGLLGLLSALPILLASGVTAILLPGLLGAVRVLLTGEENFSRRCGKMFLSRLCPTAGQPMVWFPHKLLAASIYLPAAIAGLLLPSALLPRMPSLVSGLYCFAVFNALTSAMLTVFGGKSGFLFALWATAALAALPLLPHKVWVFFRCCSSLVNLLITKLQGKLTTASLMAILAIAMPAAVVNSPLLACLPVFILEHLSISGIFFEASSDSHNTHNINSHVGAPPQPLGRFVAGLTAGIVLGLAVVTTAGFYVLLLAAQPRKVN